MVRALHLDLTGRPVPPHSPAYGRRFVVENYAALSLLTSPRRRPADGSGAGSDGVPGRTEYAWCAADDPVPAFAMGLAWLGHLLRRAVVSARRFLGSLRARPPLSPTTPPARSSSNQLTPR
ncbi:hypothetical protein ACWCQ0_52885 [Streptomyces massasporeus]